MLPQVLAVVGDQGDDGRLQEAAALQEPEQAADLAVEVGHLAVVEVAVAAEDRLVEGPRAGRAEGDPGARPARGPRRRPGGSPGRRAAAACAACAGRRGGARRRTALLAARAPRSSRAPCRPPARPRSARWPGSTSGEPLAEPRVVVAQVAGRDDRQGVVAGAREVLGEGRVARAAAASGGRRRRGSCRRGRSGSRRSSGW